MIANQSPRLRLLEFLDKPRQPFLIRRPNHAPGKLAQLVYRNGVGIDLEPVSKKKWVATDLPEGPMIFGQRCQQEGQARRTRVVRQNRTVNRAKEPFQVNGNFVALAAV